MRRATIVFVRAAIALVLLAAVFDLQVPSGSRARRRLHLIDRSASVLVEGPANSLRPDDFRPLIELDRERAEPGDEITWASFGRDVAFDSDEIDASATDLEGALEAALARNPTEIILYTDGRADPGRALLLCRERGIPVHVFPLGPTEVRDARISRIRAPANALPTEPVTVEVTVESTFEAKAKLHLEDDARDLELRPGAPALIRFKRPPGPFAVDLEIDDACDENDHAAGEVFVRSDKPRVLAITRTPLALPGYDVRVTTEFENPAPYAAVVVDHVLPLKHQEALAGYVKHLGGGLLIFDYGHDWQGTPVEEISPLHAMPDHRVAVVFGIDASGSMEEAGKLDVVIPTVQDAWSQFLPIDLKAALVIASKRARYLRRPSELKSIRASGETALVEAMLEARKHLAGEEGGRLHLILLTDGEVSKEDTPEKQRDAFIQLENDGIGLTVVTTNKRLVVGRHVPIKDWHALKGEIERLLKDIREVQKENPGPVEMSWRGFSPFTLPRMYLTTKKHDTDRVGRVGNPPYPAIAFRQAGRGHVGALTFAAADAPARLVAECVKQVESKGAGGLSLSIDGPVVRARGTGPATLEATWRAEPSGEAGTVRLDQVRSDVWEGRLPDAGAGTIVVRLGSAAAAATIPSAAEYRALGVDRDALARIAAEGGGHLLRSDEDLERLKRPKGPDKTGGRPYFLVVALALIFVELALSTFWKGA